MNAPQHLAPFVCPFCSGKTEFLTYAALLTHVENMHPDVDTVSLDDTGPGDTGEFNPRNMHGKRA
jgi:hypothetical protein